MEKAQGFEVIAIQSGMLLDLSTDRYPTTVHGWSGGVLDMRDGATHFGMVTEGDAVVEHESQTWRLLPGMFFVLPERGAVLASEGSKGLVISRLNYRGLWQIGGPLEATGRLKYIDGCSDTLLVCPPVLGEPCLNHLHIPPHTDQSAHTHPSTRLGVILRGSGECRTETGSYPLQPGIGRYFPTGCLHSFHTAEESLDVIAWHPDSDFGPTHTHHPMVSRTFVDGVSASEIIEIQTREITR
jgi:quercetin dioxygenase-like cupin family protein